MTTTPNDQTKAIHADATVAARLGNHPGTTAAQKRQARREAAERRKNADVYAQPEAQALTIVYMPHSGMAHLTADAHGNDFQPTIPVCGRSQMMGPVILDEVPSCYAKCQACFQ